MTARSAWRGVAALVILAAAGAAAVVGAGAEISATGVEERLRDLGVWAPALFMVARKTHPKPPPLAEQERSTVQASRRRTP